MGGSRKDTTSRPVLRLFNRAMSSRLAHHHPSSSEDPATVIVMAQHHHGELHEEQEHEHKPILKQQQQPQPQPIKKPSTMGGRCHSVPNFHFQEKREAIKRVSFTALEVREYNIVVGDHPCCPVGVPVTLGWEFEDLHAMNLDAYEASRCPRRQRTALRTTPEERRQMLVSAGTQEDELRRAQRQLQRARSCSTKLCERVNQSFFQAHILEE
jgi:hypothetical protein